MAKTKESKFIKVYQAYAAALALVLIGSTGTAFAQAAGHIGPPSGAPSIDTAPPEIIPAPEAAPMPRTDPYGPGSAMMAPAQEPEDQGPSPAPEDQE